MDCEMLWNQFSLESSVKKYMWNITTRREKFWPFLWKQANSQIVRDCLREFFTVGFYCEYIC